MEEAGRSDEHAGADGGTEVRDGAVVCPGWQLPAQGVQRERHRPRERNNDHDRDEEPQVAADQYIVD